MALDVRSLTVMATDVQLRQGIEMLASASFDAGKRSISDDGRPAASRWSTLLPRPGTRP